MISIPFIMNATDELLKDHRVFGTDVDQLEMSFDMFTAFENYCARTNPQFYKDRINNETLPPATLRGYPVWFDDDIMDNTIHVRYRGSEPPRIINVEVQ